VFATMSSEQIVSTTDRVILEVVDREAEPVADATRA